MTIEKKGIPAGTQDSMGKIESHNRRDFLKSLGKFTAAPALVRLGTGAGITALLNACSTTGSRVSRAPEEIPTMSEAQLLEISREMGAPVLGKDLLTAAQETGFLSTLKKNPEYFKAIIALAYKESSYDWNPAPYKISTLGKLAPSEHTINEWFRKIGIDKSAKSLGLWQASVPNMKEALLKDSSLKRKYSALLDTDGRVNNSKIAGSLVQADGAPLDKQQTIALHIDTIFIPRFENHNTGNPKEDVQFFAIEHNVGEMSSYRAAIQERLVEQTGIKLVLDGDLSGYDDNGNPDLSKTSSTVNALRTVIRRNKRELGNSENFYLLELLNAQTPQELQKSDLYRVIMDPTRTWETSTSNRKVVQMRVNAHFATANLLEDGDLGPGSQARLLEFAIEQGVTRPQAAVQELVQAQTPEDFAESVLYRLLAEKKRAFPNTKNGAGQTPKGYWHKVRKKAGL